MPPIRLGVFFALPLFAALCFFVVFVSVVVEVSPLVAEPAPIESEEPEEPLPLVADFEDFACFLWCFFAWVPVAVDEVSLLVEAEPGVAVPGSLVDDPDPMLLPDPEPMLLPGCC